MSSRKFMHAEKRKLWRPAVNYKMTMIKTAMWELPLIFLFDSPQISNDH